MLMPSIFSRDFMDDLFDMPQRTYAKSYSANGLMKTDIKESEEGFTVEMDLPGFSREDISAELKDGYLTVSAEKGLDKDEEDKKGKYIRKERYAGSLSRTFYLGEEIRVEEIKAKFENGILSVSIPKEEEKKKYRDCIFIEETENGGYRITEGFQKLLQNQNFKNMVLELLDFGIEQYKEKYADIYRDTNFQLYQKYTYEDVCRLLNWKRNMNAQNIGGYFYDADTKTLPVFINYDKAEDAIAYEDRFLSETNLIALSKHPRKITSGDVVHIYKRGEEEKSNRIFLFVRKNKDDHEAKEFYFLGEIFAEGDPNPIHMESTNDDAFEILYRLDVPVRSDIYDYIVT